MSFVIYSCKTGKCWNHNVLTNLQDFVKFWLNLWFVTLTYFLTKAVQILRKVIVIFLERGEEIEPWFWHIWIAQWLKFFPITAYLFRFRPSSWGNGWSMLDQKCKLWLRLFFMKTRILQVFFKQCFCLLEYYLWREFRQYWTIFVGVRAQKPSKKSHFMDAESIRKTLKTFDSTTTNAILMKLTTIIYLQMSVNRKPLRARNSGFWCNVYEFLDYIKNHHICHALPCVASLVKFLYKFHEKPAKIGPKWLLC